MPLTPAAVLFVWLFGLISLALPATGAWLIYEWYQQSLVYPPVELSPRTADLVPRPEDHAPRFHPDFGLNVPTALLALGSLLILVTFCGGPIFMRLLLRRGKDDPKHSRGGDVRQVERPDGTKLHVEVYGRVDGPPFVLTHGLGATSTQWYYAKRDLGGAYRVFVWDLPGSGKSSSPSNGDYSLPRLADDLKAVIDLARAESKGNAPVVVVGHSLGGMINLELERKGGVNVVDAVGGLVEAQTTYTNPLRTMKGASIYVPLQKPLIEPLLYVTIFLAPLVRLMNALSYLNGSAHLSTWWSGFKGRPTFGQVDFAAKNYLYASAVTLGRMCLAMLRWDASDLLGRLEKPVLLVPADDDTTCVPAASERMRTEIPKAQLQMVAPGRHLAILQRHADFGHALQSFADSLRKATVATRAAVIAV